MSSPPLGRRVLLAVAIFALVLGASVGCNFGSTSSSVPDGGALVSPIGHPSVLIAVSSAEDFGTVPVGQQSAPATLTFDNAGSTATGPLAVRQVGTSATDFVIDADGCMGSGVSPGASCTVKVHFAPAEAGEASATLAVLARGGEASVTLSGMGMGSAGATFVVTPSPFDFGSVEQNTPSPPEQTFTVRNSGAAAVPMPQVTVSGANATDFAITQDACTSDLVAGTACAFGVAFTPTAAAAETATVTVSAPPATSATVNVSGTGLAPASLSLSPRSQSLGSIVQGAVGADFAFAVTNGSGQTTGVLAVTLQGSQAGELALGADGCTGQNLLAGASCTVHVHGAPPAVAPVGALQASLQVSATPGGTAAATLTATVVASASLSLAPANQAMGTVVQGGTSGDLPFVVTNGGGVSSGVLKAMLAGLDASQYGLGADGCSGQALAPGASCTVEAHLTPTGGTLGIQVATLSVTGSPGGTASANLSGTAAMPAALMIGPASESFPATAQGVASADVTFTVSNSGGVPARGLGVTLGGANAGQFAIGTNGCAGQTLAASTGSCTVTAHFAPGVGTLGLEQATLAVSATPGGESTANLTGTATTPLAIGPAAPTLASGAYQAPGATTVLTVTSMSLAGVGPLAITPPAQFAVDAAKTTCSGATLSPASPTCTVGVYLDPGAPSIVGPVSGTVTVSAGANTSVSELLAATALAPAMLTLATAAGAPLPVAFGTVRENSPLTEAFVVRNAGAVTSGRVAVTVGGSPPGSNDFTLAHNACGATLAPGATCSFDVTFTPSTTRDESATLGVTTNAGVGESGILTGTGGQAVLVYENANAQPIASYAYGGAVVSSPFASFPPATATFALVNTGVVPTNALLAPGMLAAGYTITANACTGQALDSGAGCSVTVTFQNATPCAEVSTVLTMTDGAVHSSLDLSATGVTNGTDYVVSSNPAVTTLTLALNQVSPIVYTVTNCGATAGDEITSIGHDDAVDFFPFPYVDDSCTGATLGELATCSFTVDATGAAMTPGTRADLLLVLTPGTPTIAVTPEPVVIVP